MNLEGKQQIWNDYQKEIADDRYYYARSCIRQTFFPGSEWAYLDILNNKLGKTVLDDPRHTTCTGIGYHSDVVPIETIMTVVARHFALMTEAGFENMTPSCITSFGIYTEILHTWETHPEWEEKTREFLWKATKREFQKPKNLAHTSDVIYKFRNEIAAQKKYSLVDIHTGRPLQVVDHIGCHYAKMFPSKEDQRPGEDVQRRHHGWHGLRLRFPRHVPWYGPHAGRAAAHRPRPHQLHPASVRDPLQRPDS